MFLQLVKGIKEKDNWLFCCCKFQALSKHFGKPIYLIQGFFLFTELGLATYVRHRLQEGREDELAERLAGLEEEVALLRRRLGGDGPAE